jgi:hypothetical protein
MAFIYNPKTGWTEYPEIIKEWSQLHSLEIIPEEEFKIARRHAEQSTLERLAYSMRGRKATIVVGKRPTKITINTMRYNPKNTDTVIIEDTDGQEYEVSKFDTIHIA